jgi:hypothetical protein
MDARTLYLRSSEFGERLGPLVLCDETEQRALESLAPFRAEVTKEIRITGPHTYWAPSAHHAALFLQDFHQQAITDTAHVEATSRPHVGVGSLSGVGPALFRGHANSAYKLTPSLQRLTADTAAVMTRAAQYFCEYFRYYCQSIIDPPPLPAEIFNSGAQHYGIATNLLDFSADPDIAVFFASNNSNVTEGQVARVYIAPLRWLASRGLRVLLPPPLFSRLYEQRGVFVELPSTLDDAEFAKVEFPAESEFEVHRAGKPVPVMPASTWLEEIKDWALRVAAESDTFDSEKLADLSLSAAAQDEMLRSPVRELAGWIDQYSEMRYWLACTVDRATGEEHLARDILSRVVVANRALHKIHTRMRKHLGKPY